MKTKFVYPALFEPETEGGYSVSFPDLPGCFTEGDTMEEAVDMAKDAVGIYLMQLEEDGQSPPVASDPSGLHPEGNGFIALIDMDMVFYKQKHDNRSVKKTLTIPQWLNTLAEREGVNFSNVLQVALKEKLGV